ncbi:hypothetical protein [Nocardioides montaniterrae]
MSTIPAVPGPDLQGLAAVSVHGPRGVVDLTVPDAASFAEIASAYAASAALAAPPRLVLASGRELAPDATLASAGLASGVVLVAVEPAVWAQTTAPTAEKLPFVPKRQSSGALTAALAALAVALGTAAAIATDHRTTAAVAALVGAVVGIAPFGVRRLARVVTAPALGAAAGVALAWSPHAERLPTVVAAGTLAAAVTAGIGRSVTPDGSPAHEPLKVWIAAGVGWFALASACALLGTPDSVPWSLGFLIAVLGARWVPAFAIDVPDQHLLDLERLAVTAWSARERPAGKRGRVVIGQEYVDGLARSGGRTVLASSVAILVAVLVSAPLLLTSSDQTVDRAGARVMVLAGGGALLLAARNYRHVVARRLLRLAGVTGMVLVAGAVLDGLPVWLVAASLVVATGLIVMAVALGRGWRSAWWSRQAEIAEALCGATAIAALFVATGLFRDLWDHHI